MLVFYSQMLHIFRTSKGKIPFTNQLIEKILSVSDAEIEQSVKKHTDLFGVQDLISRNTNITSFGIKMEMRTVLMEIFVKGSNFCTTDSRFSIRDFVRNGHGHKLFIGNTFNFHLRPSEQGIIPFNNYFKSISHFFSPFCSDNNIICKFKVKSCFFAVIAAVCQHKNSCAEIIGNSKLYRLFQLMPFKRNSVSLQFAFNGVISEFQPVINLISYSAAVKPCWNDFEYLPMSWAFPAA